MSKTCNIFFSFLFSKHIKFMLSLFVSFFILFSSASTTFCFTCKNIDFIKVCDIQKDVLSAVFTVSNIINKINNSFIANISSNKTANKTESVPIQQSNKENNDVISITCNSYNLSNTINNFYNINIQAITINLIYYHRLFDNINFTNILIIYLLSMLCLFASTIKIFNIIKNIGIHKKSIILYKIMDFFMEEDK